MLAGRARGGRRRGPPRAGPRPASRPASTASSGCAAAAKDVGRPVGILVDLPGPKVRSRALRRRGVRLEAGSRSCGSPRPSEGDRSTRRGGRRRPARGGRRAGAGDRIALGDGGVALVVDGARRRRRRRPRCSAAAWCGAARACRCPRTASPLRSPTEDDLRMLERVARGGGRRGGGVVRADRRRRRRRPPGHRPRRARWSSPRSRPGPAVDRPRRHPPRRPTA